MARWHSLIARGVCWAAAVQLVAGTPITEYVAMAPAGGGGPDRATTNSEALVKWVLLQYDTEASQVDDVKMELLNATVPEVGAWFDLDLTVGGGSGLSLAAKIIDANLFAYIQKNASESTGLGCCADTLRVYDKFGGSKNFTEHNLDEILNSAFPASASFRAATHTFDVELEDGVVYAYLMTQYLDGTLGTGKGNAIVCFNTETGEVRKTMDGSGYWSMPNSIGTGATTLADTIFKVEYYQATAAGVEEWHGNGMLSFTASTGENLIAFTHRLMSEAVIIKDPFKHTFIDGGGTILQRFGAPSSTGNAPYHSFGISPTGPHPPPWTGGVHNVWHNPASSTTKLKGLETISLFVNSVAGATTSLAYEFALNLTTEKPGVTYDDTVFRTKNVVAACGYEALAQGGARNIANGVFLTASGVNPIGGGQFNVIDLNGGVKVVKYPMAVGSLGVTVLYDPFIRVVARAKYSRGAASSGEN